MNENTFHVDITKGDTVNASSKGLITGPTWSPGAGLSRQQEIEKARQEEFEAYQERLRQSHPAEIRLLHMEAAIADLQKKVEELKTNAQE